MLFGTLVLKTDQVRSNINLFLLIFSFICSVISTQVLSRPQYHTQGH